MHLDHIRINDLSKIKKNINIVVLLFIVCIFTTSCTINSTEKDVIYGVSSQESQLYASLSSYIEYYYSMELFSYEELIDDILREEDDNYILGKIDTDLSYNSIYINLTMTGQKNLNKEILSQNLIQTISEFMEEKDLNLQWLKNNILQNNLDSVNKSDYTNLKKCLRELNVNITTMENEEIYIEKINKCIDIMSKINDSDL